MKIENLKNKIKAYRKEFAMDQAEFAKFADLTVAEVSVFECGTQVPTRSQMLGLCKGLELKADATESLLNQIESYKIEPVQAEAKTVKPRKIKKKEIIKSYEDKILLGEMTIKEVAKETGFSFSYTDKLLKDARLQFKDATKEEQRNNKKVLKFLTKQKKATRIKTGCTKNGWRLAVND